MSLNEPPPEERASERYNRILAYVERKQLQHMNNSCEESFTMITFFITILENNLSKDKTVLIGHCQTVHKSISDLRELWRTLISKHKLFDFALDNRFHGAIKLWVTYQMTSLERIRRRMSFWTIPEQKGPFRPLTSLQALYQSDEEGEIYRKALEEPHAIENAAWHLRYITAALDRIISEHRSLEKAVEPATPSNHVSRLKFYLYKFGLKYEWISISASKEEGMGIWDGESHYAELPKQNHGGQNSVDPGHGAKGKHAWEPTIADNDEILAGFDKMSKVHVAVQFDIVKRLNHNRSRIVWCNSTVPERYGVMEEEIEALHVITGTDERTKKVRHAPNICIVAKDSDGVESDHNDDEGYDKAQEEMRRNRELEQRLILKEAPSSNAHLQVHPRLGIHEKFTSVRTATNMKKRQPPGNTVNPEKGCIKTYSSHHAQDSYNASRSETHDYSEDEH